MNATSGQDPYSCKDWMCMGQLYLTTFGASEWLILILWLLAVATPIAYSFRNKTPIALGISVGLLLGYIVQYACCSCVLRCRIKIRMV